VVELTTASKRASTTPERAHEAGDPLEDDGARLMMRVVRAVRDQNALCS
jgi:hypothetical protein